MFARFRFDAKRSRGATREPPESADDNASVVGVPGDIVTCEADDAQARELKRVKVEVEEDQNEPRPEPEDATLRPKWQERWHAICSPCFEARVECEHFPERRLRLLIVGHNPSDHAWASGFSYSNPSNRFWNLLRGCLSPLSWPGILPVDAHISEQNRLPHLYGVGLTSIGLEPGNDAASYSKATMTRWRDDFFRRLKSHAARVCKNEHGTDDLASCPHPHSPMIIAFSGKRQFSWLFSPPLAKVENFGMQTQLPSGWPRECLHDCEVWVLPSSSGRAAMTTAQRAQPYQDLAVRFHQFPWPTSCVEIIKSEILD